MNTDYEQTILYYEVSYANEYLLELERDSGLEHPDTLLQLSKIVKLTYKARMYKDAKRFACKLYNRCLKVYGNLHPCTIEAKNILNQIALES